jgi:V-containing nitrogenase delta subunit
MTSKLDDLFAYVQERCLWQFASRTWDRTANIEGVLKQVGHLLKGEAPSLETPALRTNFAEAKVLVDDCRQRYGWVDTIPPDEVDLLLAELKQRLIDVTITRSKNRELNHTLN